MTYDTKQLENLGGYQPKCVEVRHPLDSDCKINHKRNYCYFCGQTVKNQKYCHNCGGKLKWPVCCQPPTSAPPETLGQNTYVIKPKMRVNKDAGQTLACPKCGKTFPLYMKVEFNGHVAGCPNYHPLSCDEPKQPNQKLLTEIEGLMNQLKDKIHSLSYTKIRQDRTIKDRALEEIDKFKTTLRELKSSFTSE